MPETTTETALELARKAAGVFAERGFENARLEAELLLAAALGLRRLDLYLQHDRPIALRELETFRGYVRRRLRREPLQYIAGQAQFRHLVLEVDRRVLVPRPETEVLVGQVIAWLAARDQVAQLAVVDIGTGSGAIALSLAQEAGLRRVLATDVSPEALAVARQNAIRCGLAERVDFRRGDLLEALREDERFDAIVSNPPYIAESERASLPPEVSEWEPPGALFAGDGLNLLQRLVDGAARHLNAGGLLAVEVGVTQAQTVAGRMAGGEFENIRVVRDLAGRERVVMGERA